MAIVQCPNCGINVAAQARLCPKCGYVFGARTRPVPRDIRKQVLLVVLVASLVGLTLAFALAR